MKNKVYNILKILAVLIIILATLTACGEKEETSSNETKKTNKVTKSDADVSKLVLNEIENGTFNMIDNETIESLCNEVKSEIIPDDVSGVLSIAVQDFDDDGQEEAIVVNINNNAISLDLYTPDEENLIKTDSYIISEDLLEVADMIDFSIFAKEEEGKINLYYESKGTTSIFANGTEWNFGKLSVENAEIKEEAHEGYVGSMMDSETEGELIKAVNKAGLEVEEIGFIGRSLVFQLDDIIEICNISRTHTDEYNSLMTALSSGVKTKSESIRYGHTIYINLINIDDCRLNMEISDINKTIKDATYEMELDSEKATVTFENENDVSYCLVAVETGTYKILGNRVIAIYSSVQDPTTEDYVRINDERHYRVIDNKLIDGTDIYIKTK